MAVERKTVLDTLSVDRYRNVAVRLALLTVNDGAELVCEWHRLTIPDTVDPGSLLDSISEALVNRGYTAISDADKQTILDFHALYVVAPAQE